MVHPAGGDVGWDADLVPIDDLVLVVAVHQGIVLDHLGRVLDVVVDSESLDDVRLVIRVGDAAAVVGLAVEVALALPGRQASEVPGALSGDAPVRHAHAGVAQHGALAVAPLLLADPVNDIGAVLGVLRAPQVNVALGMAHAAGVDVDDGVAVGNPEAGVGGLELGVLGHGLGGNAHELPGIHALGGILAEGTEAADGRHLVRGVVRTVDVDVDVRAVAQGDGLVALADHVRDVGQVGVGVVRGAKAHRAHHLHVIGTAGLGCDARSLLDQGVELLSRPARVALRKGNVELLVAKDHLLVDIGLFSHLRTPSLSRMALRWRNTFVLRAEAGSNNREKSTLQGLGVHCSMAQYF